MTFYYISKLNQSPNWLKLIHNLRFMRTFGTCSICPFSKGIRGNISSISMNSILQNSVTEDDKNSKFWIFNYSNPAKPLSLVFFPSFFSQQPTEPRWKIRWKTNNVYQFKNLNTTLPQINIYAMQKVISFQIKSLHQQVFNIFSLSKAL